MKRESLEYQLNVAESDGMIARTVPTKIDLTAMIYAKTPENILEKGRPIFVNEIHEQERATGEGMPEALRTIR